MCIGYSDACAWSPILQGEMAPDYPLAQKEMGNSLCFGGEPGSACLFARTCAMCAVMAVMGVLFLNGTNEDLKPEDMDS